ncbi:uncharacterized protein LOC125315393 [Rhodamnia argentea]|uniref:Uncharacterized protein LOC125315393 n=1 Tax=Rhodamnia argentea TaxID=178133 RepID=A0ABM3HHH4_9MYRT|nr:uncharacterized protein LOC125315393 [Rhodamnia argentea]
MTADMWRVYNRTLYNLPKVTFSVNGSSITIEVLHGSNFKKWREDFLFAMEPTDVHVALYEDKPANLIETSTTIEMARFAAWEKSNRICLLSMKRSIHEHLKSSLAVDCTAKEIIEVLMARNRVSSNAEVGTLV